MADLRLGCTADEQVRQVHPSGPCPQSPRLTLGLCVSLGSQSVLTAGRTRAKSLFCFCKNPRKPQVAVIQRTMENLGVQGIVSPS